MNFYFCLDAGFQMKAKTLQNKRLDDRLRNMSGKRHPGLYVKFMRLDAAKLTARCLSAVNIWKTAARQIYRFSQYQLRRDTFSFFCDSGEQLEILNFLPHTQDLGLTVCRCQKHRSPKRCLPVPKQKAYQSARASGTGPSAATDWKQKI